MKANKGFEETLELTKIALRMSGLKIDQNASSIFRKKLHYLFYFNLIWLYTDVVSEFSWLIEGILIGKDFEELTYIAPCITVTLLGTAKCSSLYFNINLVIELIQKLREIHPKSSAKEINKYSVTDATSEGIKDDLETKEDKVVDFSMKYLNLIIMFMLFSCCVVVTAFSCLPIFFMIFDYVTKGTTDMKYPLLCKYFFDTSRHGTAICVYLHQVWSTVLAAMNVFGADTLLYACCTFVQMHFRILKLRLEAFANDGDVRMKLDELVKRHQLLIDIVSRMEYLYSKSTLFNFITSSFLVCLSGFNVTSSKEPGAVFSFVTFLFMSLTQIFMLCYCGDMIMRTSVSISNAAYHSRWYLTDQSLRKSIHIIMMRAQKPCKITAANFADLNLGAYTTILSRSWSYFALLKTIYN